MPVHAGKLIAFCYCVKPYHVIGHTVIAVSMNRNNLNEMFHKCEYILLTHIQSGAMMRVRKKEISVMVVFAGNKDEFLSAIRQLKPEDCVEIDSFASVAGSAGDMLSAIVSIDGKRADFISIKEKIDTRTEHGRAIFAVCRELYSLDRVRQREKQRNGIEKAKQEGKYKGRKPIFVDESLFEDIVNLWKNGEITARQAMSRLELKPNTFYRRIREWEADQIKKAGRELKTELDALKGKIQ